MSSLYTTYHNVRAANGNKSPHLESHKVLEKMKKFESNPNVKPMHIAIGQYIHMVGVNQQIDEIDWRPCWRSTE